MNVSLLDVIVLSIKRRVFKRSFSIITGLSVEKNLSEVYYQKMKFFKKKDKLSTNDTYSIYLDLKG
jgi:hypothetical protein